MKDKNWRHKNLHKFNRLKILNFYSEEIKPQSETNDKPKKRGKPNSLEK